MSEPAYKRIQNHILQAISQGELSAGMQIPTEMDLAHRFKVSRMTVNKALTGLSSQNILTRIAGKGTFVAETKVETPLIHVVDFAEEIRNRGHQYRAEVLVHKWLLVYDNQALALGVANGAQAGYCEILHYENDLPLILEKRYVNATYLTEFLAQDFTQITPTAYLLAHYPLTEIEHTVEAISADAQQAQCLQITVNDPCLLTTRRTWGEGILVSYALILAAGQRYKLRSRYFPNALS
ncbi:MAG: UTRA domain-containing protein [Neisseriaceae bacterium]|nr:UTRA domain-containing protein [Neisseriaceae bacterium]MBP6861016.1 UTRA domain-containing protein [Neisseriaceae bacterium]